MNPIELLCTGTERQWTLVFRPLTDVEEEAGYQIVCDTVEWLWTKGIKLWTKPLPREVYAARHQRGENYGLFADGKLAAIVSLVRGAPQQWAEELPDRRIMWMSTLTTANAFRGRSLGREMVRHALQFLSGRGEKGIYLDCKPGFLESFYEAEGFVPIRRKSHASQHYPGESFETVLMQWGVCPWSARLRMRPMTLDDVDNLLMIFADPAAMEFWPALKTREEIVRSVEWMQRSYRENGYGLWAAALKDTGEFVGRVGLIRQDDVAGRVEVEVAYALVPRHWHRGYATEAARACRDWAFTHLDCDCVISLVHTRNLPSCRVAERNGMRVVAEITRWNLPHRVYAITRAEWKQLR